ncbi:LysM peptidoglycan-binding domain-containing protein [candidate division KSB1 bacterium]|nr:LysM peptidoglycan-binding domain-containing protein [candidate division KSB1 bacterium]
MKTHRRHIVSVLLLMLIILPVQVTGSTIRSTDQFPLPESLKPNVEFWIKVYSEYHDYEVAIHDNVDLTIVYEIVDLRKFGDYDDYTDATLWEHVEEIQKRYELCLRQLGERAFINHEDLTDFELKIYTLLDRKTDPAVYREAADCIRAQRGLRDHFMAGLIRSGRYIDYIKTVLHDHGLPAEISVLPHVESSFNIHAYSKFGAAGLWQFTRSTGRLFLDINYSVDQRLDPEKATEAAAKLMKRNYDILGTWPLAITAYNHGTNGMKKAIRELRTTDIGEITSKYTSRQFKFASRNFYAEFLAARHVVENYRDYFGDIEFDNPMQYHTITLPNYITITTISRLTDLTIEEIHDYNPSLRPSVLSSSRHIPKGFELKIPWRGDDFNIYTLLAAIPSTEKKNRQIESNWYQVQPGDNLKGIARRAGTTVDEIMALNDDIVDVHRIYVNQIIRLPEPEEVELVQSQSMDTNLVDNVSIQVESDKSVPIVLQEGGSFDTSVDDVVYYTVKSGDNLETIAARFKSSVDELIRLNDIKDSDMLVVGQRIKVMEKPVSVAQVMVEEALVVSDSDTTLISGEAIANLITPIPHGPSIEELMQIGPYQKVDVAEAGVPNLSIEEVDDANESQTLETDDIPVHPDLPSRPSNEIQDSVRRSEQNVLRLSDLISDHIIVHGVANAEYDTTMGRIYVLPDETLGHYADWLEVRTQQIRDWNGLSYYENLQLNKLLTLHFLTVSQKLFMQRRLEYHKSIEEDFYRSFYVQGVQLHRLQRGESVWELTNVLYEVPYWLMMKYNPNLKLNELHPGDEIIIPIIRSNEG